jgi:hypothetical protein
LSHTAHIATDLKLNLLARMRHAQLFQFPRERLRQISSSDVDAGIEFRERLGR